MAKLIEIAGPKLGEYQVVLAGVVVHFIFETGSGVEAVFEALQDNSDEPSAGFLRGSCGQSIRLEGRPKNAARRVPHPVR
jgi:hypothetical protein